MPTKQRLAAFLPRLYLGTALSFAAFAAAFVAVVFLCNITRHDRTPLILTLAIPIPASGLLGFLAALLGYRITCGQTFNQGEWRTGSLLFAGALLAAAAALVTIKCAFPELPE